ncbi:hypothetical protein FXO38_27969 [Capsicum annuum]|nr:hypothetical protein FXO38_27969 [Capsicum annuum]KAF3658308.1 hypothetical protein FXO37_14469 [Capsicum annuum]
MTCTTYISLIKDPTSPVLAQTALSPPTSILDHLEGTSILVKPIEVTYATTDVEIGDLRVDPETFTSGEEATTTITLALTLTSNLVGTSIIPLRPIANGLIRVPREFLPPMVQRQDEVASVLNKTRHS